MTAGQPLICKSVITCPTVQGWDEGEQVVRGSLDVLNWGQIMNVSLLPVARLCWTGLGML